MWLEVLPFSAFQEIESGSFLSVFLECKMAIPPPPLKVTMDTALRTCLEALPFLHFKNS